MDNQDLGPLSEMEIAYLRRLMDGESPYQAIYHTLYQRYLQATDVEPME